MEGARDARRQIGDGAAARHDPVGRRRGEVREQVDEAAATSGDGETSEVIGELVGSDGEMSEPRGEAAAGSAANRGSSAMAAASSGGEADELIGEMAGSAVNEMGDAMATASGGGEARRKKTKRSKKSGAARRAERHEQEDGPDEGSGVAVTSIGVAPPRPEPKP